MGSNWALPSCCCGEGGKWGFVCHLYSPGFLTWLSKRKRARDFLLWFLLSPAIVKGLRELKKSIKIPVRTEPWGKEPWWLWCSWWSLFFGLTATWDWPCHIWGEFISCLLGKSYYRSTECNCKADTSPGLWICFSQSARASFTVTDHHSHLLDGTRGRFYWENMVAEINCPVYK